MARPLRIEYPGAHYHVTSRGNERKDVFKSQGIYWGQTYTLDKIVIIMILILPEFGTAKENVNG